MSLTSRVLDFLEWFALIVLHRWDMSAWRFVDEIEILCSPKYCPQCRGWRSYGKGFCSECGHSLDVVTKEDLLNLMRKVISE